MRKVCKKTVNEGAVMGTVRKYFRIGDIIVLLLVLLASLVLGMAFSKSGDGDTFYIKRDGIYETYSLVTDREIQLVSNGIEVKVTVSEGKVLVTSATCPDKLCVNSKPVSKKGETIVCLPARLVVGISGDYGNEVDGVVG